MADAARRRATYEDVLAAPSRFVTEIVDGVLHSHPRPAGPHAAVASALSEELGPPFKRGRGGPGGWLLLFEPELHLGDEPDILVPDLAAWRRDRLAAVPRTPYLTLSPDWVCEIVSPSTARLDRAGKLPVYARERVRHVWLADPLGQTVEVLRLEPGLAVPGYAVLTVAGGDDRVRLEPFEALELDLSVLWADIAEE